MLYQLSYLTVLSEQDHTTIAEARQSVLSNKLSLSQPRLYLSPTANFPAAATFSSEKIAGQKTVKIANCSGRLQRNRYHDRDCGRLKSDEIGFHVKPATATMDRVGISACPPEIPVPLLPALKLTV